jgi:leucine dehydrogenase
MELFETVIEMGHEQVLFCHAKAVGLRAIIAIHDTSLGPAMGATRLRPYASEADALRDVLRLSRGMTYKAAGANLPVGGGKAVIIAAPEQKTADLFRAYGEFVESLKGRFVTGQDVNLTPEDVQQIGRSTSHVVGTLQQSGGPVPITAMGVLLGIKAAVEFQLQTTQLAGLTVAVQGLGNVGQQLCQHLHAHHVNLIVCDVDQKKAAAASRLYGAIVVEPSEIYAVKADIFSPCALGGILNNETIAQLQVQIVAGAANNQLENELIHSQLLTDKHILYCPDYVINAGGLINVYNEMIGYEESKALAQLNNIYTTLTEIFATAQAKQITSSAAAKELVEQRIFKARSQKVGVSQNGSRR